MDQDHYSPSVDHGGTPADRPRSGAVGQGPSVARCTRISAYLPWRVIRTDLLCIVY